ncbi:hypothetical protein FRB94_007536 [Tulasnella sp. JGI-2019a]|nr:hypothetical protein FRB94_007536 [Tulasnella sp. JGI-2019a]KAG9016084.1 hypothetical protein FRB93_011558 [Tulasnella sp. JGI-2019a]KAG9028886.1 hypothetical protein FRB95_005936 [Tulasnella sp. JGI-2019a]
MAIGPPSSAIYLQPPSSTSIQGRPLTVTIHPSALFSILDHYLRATTPTSKQRVLGTLLGTRNEANEIEVRSAFAVGHSEAEEQIVVDGDYHKMVLELHQKVNPKEVVVGWYSTGGELDSITALIHNFYAAETGSNQAIHVSVNTGVQEEGQLGVKAYVGAPVGVFPNQDNCAFIPVPCELKFQEAERGGLDILSKAADGPVPAYATELETLELALLEVISMIDRVLVYVQSVTSGKAQGDERVGRNLLGTLSATVEGLEKNRLESLFNSHLQDTLMVSYITNLVRSQVEISSRLVLLT